MKKFISKLHLWLGLSSGLVVFIVAITGCLYAFQHEIQEITQDYRFVEPSTAKVLPPSKIREIADRELPGQHIHGVVYQGLERAAKVVYYKYEEYYDFVYVNPYTGEVLKVKDELKDFFRIILDGHFYLWLPHQIGQPVVAVFTLIFVFMCLSGLYLWWPRSKKGKLKRFKIKWNGRWRRKNYDLHSVIGFYILLIALVFGLTGLVWGFEWFRDGAHSLAGGTKSLNYVEPSSDTLNISAVDASQHVDILWKEAWKTHQKGEVVEVHFPVTKQSPILLEINRDPSTYWQMDYIYYDQYSLEEIEVPHIYSRFEQADVADQMIRLNYDIHTGAIFGFAGKLFMFFASLLIASLPVTGTLLWWGRRKK